MRIFVNIRKYPSLYLLAIPVVLWYVLFCYRPMYGIIIAFQRFVPNRGIWNSTWVGLQNFSDFFKDIYFGRLLRNTLYINVKMLIFGFPIPIIFALLLNEIRSTAFRRVSQSITYMPHFISSMIICGLMVDFCKTNGLLTSIFGLFGYERVNLLSRGELFQGLYVGMNIWQEFGWDSIIYFAALTAIDPVLYEAATVDGASRFRRMLHITLPGISGTVVILLILRIGNLMSLGWERVFLLYNPKIYETADIISTYVFRRGIIEFQYSYATAVGFFNSVVNVILLLCANYLSKRVSETSLW
ncbi:MAG: ABC transporter permease subunit [Oscillospiraceae bacterium]|nr:ABC transporter permease subunit [Oscillospiraceae bacterium]